MSIVSPEVERAQRARRKFGASRGKKIGACLTTGDDGLRLSIRNGNPDENVRDAECEW
jgi:hypothetical protein